MKRYAQSDENIIRAEIERLGIQQSESEKKLWADAYKFTGIDIEVSNENADAMHTRFYDVLERMLHSENPHFKKASNDLLTLRQQNRLAFKALSAEQGATTSLALKLVAKDGKVAYDFYISPQFILNGSSALTLAGNITHEARHVESHESQANGLPSNFTVEEKIAELERRSKDPRLAAIEEGLGFGADAQAYIYKCGLLGEVYDVVISGEEDRAAKFIQSGSNPSDPRWITYIGSFPEYQDLRKQ